MTITFFFLKQPEKNLLGLKMEKLWEHIGPSKSPRSFSIFLDLNPHPLSP